MTIKVIGAGDGRTGTASLREALEHLGIRKCYHMFDVVADNRRADAWYAAGLGHPVDWERVFDGYQGTVDVPGCFHYKALMERYPDAKVILTVRDPERWYKSVDQTIYQFRDWIEHLPPLVGRLPQLRRMQRFLLQTWAQRCDDRFHDRDYAIAAFKRHIDEVRAHVPSERLLVYEVSEGWGPLCAFLELPVPEGVAFPWVNDSAAMKRSIRRTKITFAALELSLWAILITIFCLGVYLLLGKT